MAAVDRNEHDHLLIRRTLDGDQEAFGILMRRYQRDVHSLLRGVLRNSSDADDLTQEAFYRAYRYLDRFDLRRPFAPWIHRIGLNLAFRHLRRSRMGTFSLEDEHPATGRSLRDALPSPGAERRITGRLELRQIEEALGQIPPMHRSILTLRGIHGLRYEEIAAILGIPEGTVMSRLSRARAALRDILGSGNRREPR